MMKRIVFSVILGVFLILGIAFAMKNLLPPVAAHGSLTVLPEVFTPQPEVDTPTATLASTSTQASPPTRVPEVVAAATATVLPGPTALPTATAYVSLPPEQWKEWPVMPHVSDAMRQLYQKGLEMGTDPNAFSFLGDCQSVSDHFLGIYENNPTILSTLPESLQETVLHFTGSFNRYSPAMKSGSSAGSLLYAAWNDNLEGYCKYGETPVDCELRVHRPSIVFIHTGTHYESRERNWYYLTIIIEKIMDTGAVPVLVTKADNLELDERINSNFALLAAKYDIPLWNFWASVQDLPNGGLQEDGMHLTDVGLNVHRTGALMALDTVWRAVR